MDAAHIESDLEKVLLTQQQIHDRLAELAAEVERDYAGEDILLVGVLKGAVMVMADLARALTVPLGMEFMAVSSASSRTSTRTSAAATCWSWRTSSTPG